METVAIVKCPDYKKTTVKDAISRIFDLIGFDFPSGVLLKPNMLSARNPDEAVTTHPVILEVLSELLPHPVFIGDSPPNTSKTIEYYWNQCQYEDVSKKTKAKLVKLEGKSSIFTLNVKGRKVNFPVSSFAFQHPVFNLPKFKTHNITILTCCMKNLYGLIPGYPKGLLHTEFPEPEYFNHFIVEFYQLLKETVVFNIVDAVEVMDKNGPSSGRKKYYGYLIAGKNGVCVDFVCATLAGLKIHEVPFLRIYENIYGIPKVKIIGDQPENIPGFQVPSSSAIFKMQENRFMSGIIRTMANQLNIIPVINHNICVKCMECVKVCPARAISNDLKIDRKKCINCLCCFEVCPNRAINVRKSFLARIILP
ncbi:MAG: DUF362 domain-containing protein [Candidatus Omnitrophica bacterium]|jgi:uncharacterized protein (DUF362 family)|nr:DUF362 domain-containing protein [Candidatus Omnitrophota bacterium]